MANVSRRAHCPRKKCRSTAQCAWALLNKELRAAGGLLTASGHRASPREPPASRSTTCPKHYLPLTLLHHRTATSEARHVLISRRRYLDHPLRPATLLFGPVTTATTRDSAPMLLSTALRVQRCRARSEPSPRPPCGQETLLSGPEAAPKYLPFSAVARL